MTLASVAKSLEKFSVDNSPAILSAIGVVGTITTAVFSAKAGVESNHILEDRALYPYSRSDLTVKEKAELTWREWVLPVSVGTVTVTSIILANRIGTRRAAAMATAYMITAEAFDEYKHKVVEKIGEHKERSVRDEVAQDRVSHDRDTTIIVGDGQVLCYDQFTGRYFSSTMETIKKAMNDTNYQVLNDNNASLSEFYARLGLPATSFSEEVGWSSDKLMDILFSTVLSEEGKPCISIDFSVVPTRNYYKFL